MEILKDMVGKVVANDVFALAETLGVTHLWHAGYFKFGARYKGVEVDIVTTPVGEEAEKLRVVSVRASDGDFQSDDITKIGITYHMVRGRETAETYIELPISQKRYKELAQGLQPNSKAWQSIADALKELTFLQGYDELGSWSVELTIKAEGDEE
jgi:hypothetical protein